MTYRIVSAARFFSSVAAAAAAQFAVRPDGRPPSPEPRELLASLADTEIDGYKESFMLYDKDGDGTISTKVRISLTEQ